MIIVQENKMFLPIHQLHDGIGISERNIRHGIQLGKVMGILRRNPVRGHVPAVRRHQLILCHGLHIVTDGRSRTGPDIVRPDLHPAV